MRRLTDDIVLSVKDAVRNLRFAIRSEARPPVAALLGNVGASPPPSRAQAERRRRSRVANLVDKVLTEVESGALALVSPAREVRHGLAFPRPVSDYFGRGRPSREDAAERLFARSYYHAAKTLLRGYGLENLLIFEHVIGRAHQDVVRRHGDLVHRISHRPGVADDPQGRDDRVRMCAALTRGLVAARPIKEIDFATQARSTPRGLLASPNAYCFTVMGLATAIASVRDEAALPETHEVIESANMVVDLRFGRFAGALESDQPEEALALEFGEVLPFLP